MAAIGEGISTARHRVWAGTTLAQRRQARRSALLEAALDLIGASGAAGVTMRGVCRRAGLTTRYFYENFATRDELLDFLYRQVAAEYLSAVAACAMTASPRYRADHSRRHALVHPPDPSALLHRYPGSGAP